MINSSSLTCVHCCIKPMCLRERVFTCTKDVSWGPHQCYGCLRTRRSCTVREHIHSVSVCARGWKQVWRAWVEKCEVGFILCRCEGPMESSGDPLKFGVRHLCCRLGQYWDGLNRFIWIYTWKRHEVVKLLYIFNGYALENMPSKSLLYHRNKSLIPAIKDQSVMRYREKLLIYDLKGQSKYPQSTVSIG